MSTYAHADGGIVRSLDVTDDGLALPVVEAGDDA